MVGHLVKAYFIAFAGVGGGISVINFAIIIGVDNLAKITVGRAENASVRVLHESVSRCHCTISIASPSRIFIEDMNSTNGTKANLGGDWVVIDRMVPVTLDTMIMMGDYSATVRGLLECSPAAMSLLRGKAEDAPKIRRNPETGEIIKK